jgi:tRNA (Thr-GGU) A37 N-methylase
MKTGMHLPADYYFVLGTAISAETDGRPFDYAGTDGEQACRRGVAFWKIHVHPRGDDALPLTGVLASRGRGHPNPIGLAVVDLCKVDRLRLTVRRLDAYDGTPVLDIKPYDRYDAYTDIRVPEWLRLRQSDVPRKS